MCVRISGSLLKQFTYTDIHESHNAKYKLFDKHEKENGGAIV